VGTTGTPAYLDDLQLVTEGPVATTYDVEVATNSAFTNVNQEWTGLGATAADRPVTVEELNRRPSLARPAAQRGREGVVGCDLCNERPRAAALLREGPPGLDPGGRGPGRATHRDRQRDG